MTCIGCQVLTGTYWCIWEKRKSTVFKQDPLGKLQAAFTLSLEEKSSAFFCVLSLPFTAEQDIQALDYR